MFFTSWGYWNIYYYPHLHQWISTLGAISTVAMNTLYIALAIHFRTRKVKMSKDFWNVMGEMDWLVEAQIIKERNEVMTVGDKALEYKQENTDGNRR